MIWKVKMTFSGKLAFKNINTLVFALIVLNVFLCINFTDAKLASMDPSINLNATSNESSDEITSLKSDEDKNDSFDELNQSNESDITTKIYKSTDPSFELLDKQSDIDPASETDILSKEELISKKKNHTSSVIHRKKKIESGVVEEKSRTLLPWLVLVLLILILSFIFKYLLQKKV